MWISPGNIWPCASVSGDQMSLVSAGKLSPKYFLLYQLNHLFKLRCEDAMIYRIEEKCSALGQLGRHSLLLSKVGCPVGVREHLPVDGSVFDQLEEGDEIEITIRKRA